MNQLLIHCDGGSRSNPGKAAAAFVVYKDDKEIYSQGFYLGIATNNFAEYTAVIKALEWIIENKMNDQVILFNLDSQLVVNQLKGIFKVKEKTLLDLVIKIKDLENKYFKSINFNYVPREKNKVADLLVNKTLDNIAA